MLTDKQTPGLEVMGMFSESNEEGKWFEESASHIIERALFLGLGGRFLINFAEHIRSRKSAMEALANLVESHPELDDAT